MNKGFSDSDKSIRFRCVLQGVARIARRSQSKANIAQVDVYPIWSYALFDIQRDEELGLPGLKMKRPGIIPDLFE